MAALAMAILLNGMTNAEVVRWTTAMIDTGERMDFSLLPRPTVDKHSTEGWATRSRCRWFRWWQPAGAAVPQRAAAALGHTGGTLDKLESIPATRAAEQRRDDGGAARRGRGDSRGWRRAGAGRPQLHALRDVTGTVESIPLIASSIMSKKIAEGASGSSFDEDGVRRLASILPRPGSWPRRWSGSATMPASPPVGVDHRDGRALGSPSGMPRGAGGRRRPRRRRAVDVVELTIVLAREMPTWWA